MIFDYLKLNINIKDEEFNMIYPDRIRNFAKRHWTPVAIAKQAADFLAERPGTKVLDIGSGTGKFCMIGATHTKGHFTGVEQSRRLVKISNKLLQNYNIRNVNFIQANITTIDFKKYDAFYFFNSFLENIDLSAKVDDTVHTHPDLYALYTMFIGEQFAFAPIGTKLVTYWSSLNEVPSNYELQGSFCDDLLKFWQKTS